MNNTNTAENILTTLEAQARSLFDEGKRGGFASAEQTHNGNLIKVIADYATPSCRSLSSRTVYRFRYYLNGKVCAKAKLPL